MNTTITNMFNTLIKPFFGDKTLFTKFCSDKQHNRLLVLYVDYNMIRFFNKGKVISTFNHIHDVLRVLFARPLSKSYQEKI